MSALAATVERTVATATITTAKGAAAATICERAPVATVVAGQGPAGPRGPGGNDPTLYAINAAASITVRHGLSFAPEAWIVTAAGEAVEADVLHAPGMTTVMFPSPFTGTLYLR